MLIVKANMLTRITVNIVPHAILLFKLSPLSYLETFEPEILNTHYGFMSCGTIFYIDSSASQYLFSFRVEPIKARTRK